MLLSPPVHVGMANITNWIYTIIRLSLDDTGVSQQMAFISGQTLHLFSSKYFDIAFKIFQDLAVVTHTQTAVRHTIDYNMYNPPPTLGLIIIYITSTTIAITTSK